MNIDYSTLALVLIFVGVCVEIVFNPFATTLLKQWKENQDKKHESEIEIEIEKRKQQEHLYKNDDNQVIQESILNPMNHYPENVHPHHQLIDSMDALNKVSDMFGITVDPEMEIDNQERIENATAALGIEPDYERLQDIYWGKSKHSNDEQVTMYFDDEFSESDADDFFEHEDNQKRKNDQDSD